MRFAVPVAALCFVLAAASQPGAVAIFIDDFAFTPADITIAPGTTVTWTNHDDMPHTISAVSRPGGFASSALNTSETFSYRFDQAGRFSYFCALHPRMQGVVTVR